MTQAPWAQRELLDQKKRIDAICDQFEGACRAGQRPLIQDYVLRVSEAERDALREELLAIEKEYPGSRTRPPHVVLAEDDPPPPIDVESTVNLPPPTRSSPSSRYRILRLHDRGGMGEVWLADDLDIGRRVAYKRIRSDRVTLAERFVIEAQITGQLEHPGVVPVHDLGEDADGKPFYAMRFLKGRTLKEIIAESHEEMARQPKSRELCLVKLLEIYLTVCRTVAYAHHRGVIHRDIKPDNVMVGSFGETLVIDWGLAKVLHYPDWLLSQPVHPTPGAGSTATVEGNVVGSLPYIAPETAAGKIDEIDEKTDVYLLGGTLYEILTGRPPRQGSSREEIIELARTTLPKPPRHVNRHAPRALEAICQRAMSRDKGSRYESAKEIAEEVERFLAGERVRAYAEPWTERVGRWVRRHRRALARAALAVAFAAVVVVGTVAWRKMEGDKWAAIKALEEKENLDQARQDDQDLRRLVDQLHYALADTTAIDERLSLTEPGAAEKFQEQIDAILAAWQPDLSQFPLAKEREELIRLLAELTLCRVQGQVARPMTAEQAMSVLKELDRIVGWKPSQSSYQRLRATCYSAAGESELAAEAVRLHKLAEPAPFDYFLQGEQIRTEALASRNADDDGSLGLTDRSRLPEAIALYEQCLKGDPRDRFQFWARLQKGRCHLLLDEIDKALSELDQAVALRPQSPWAWSVRGFVHAVLRHDTAAEHDLKYALQLEPEFAAARLHLGVVQLLRGQVAESKSAFAQFAKQHPNSIQARYYLALAEHKGRDYPAALKECSTILDSHPDLTAPRFLRVQIYLELGRPKEARADLDDWLAQREPQLDPAGPEAAARRCHVWRVLGERISPRRRRIARELAVSDGNAAAAGNIKLPELYGDLAAVLIRLERSDEALKAMEEGLALGGSRLSQARLRTLRGYALLETKDYEQCREDFSHVTQLVGDQRDAQLLRADAHALLGYVAALQAKPDEALREAGLAPSQLRNVNNYQLWINLAGVYNTLADSNAGDAPILQDTALEMLENAMFQARRSGSTDKAIENIRNDPALKSLQELPRFREIVPTPAP